MAQAEQKTGGSRRIKWALGVSLALNLLMVGLIAGAAFRHGGGGDRRDFANVNGYGAPYVRALPRETRQAMGKALRAARGAFPSRAERRALYAQLLEALRAEPFEAGRVAALFETQRGHALAVQSAAQEVWLKEVGAMSPQERAQMADRLEEVLRRGPRKRDQRPRD